MGEIRKFPCLYDTLSKKGGGSRHGYVSLQAEPFDIPTRQVEFEFASAVRGGRPHRAKITLPAEPWLVKHLDEEQDDRNEKPSVVMVLPERFELSASPLPRQSQDQQTGKIKHLRRR